MPVTLSDQNADLVRRALAYLAHEHSDAGVRDEARDLLACLGVLKSTTPVPAAANPDPYGLGGCPHHVTCEPDSNGVSVGHTWCGAFAVGRDRSPGPEANATCSLGHTNRVGQWPGYRPAGGGGPGLAVVTDHLADALARLEDWNPWPVGGAPLTPLVLPCEDRALQNWWRLRKVEHAARARRRAAEWPWPGTLPASLTAPIHAADLSLDKRRPMAERYGPSPMAAMLAEHAADLHLHPRHLLDPAPVWTDALAWAAEALPWLRRELFADEHAVVWAAGVPTGPDAAWWVWAWDRRDGARPPKVGLRLNPDTGGILVRRAQLSEDGAVATVTLPTRGTWAEAVLDVRTFLVGRATAHPT